MKTDNTKTNSQLINEVKKLRNQSTEFEEIIMGLKEMTTTLTTLPKASRRRNHDE
jgi:hypothetical protein